MSLAHFVWNFFCKAVNWYIYVFSLDLNFAIKQFFYYFSIWFFQIFTLVICKRFVNMTSWLAFGRRKHLNWIFSLFDGHKKKSREAFLTKRQDEEMSWWIIVTACGIQIEAWKIYHKMQWLFYLHLTLGFIHEWCPK